MFKVFGGAAVIVLATIATCCIIAPTTALRAQKYIINIHTFLTKGLKPTPFVQTQIRYQPLGQIAPGEILMLKSYLT
jgi:hypothetical protein